MKKVIFKSCSRYRDGCVFTHRVEIDKKEYRLRSNRRLTTPEIEDFPYNVPPEIAINPIVTFIGGTHDSLWKASSFRCKVTGGMAELRILDDKGNDPFPVCKFFVQREHQPLAEHEFLMLRSLSGLDCVVRVAPDPIVDCNGLIVGFRMEPLNLCCMVPLNSSLRSCCHRNSPKDVLDVLEKAVQELHSAGVAHNYLKSQPRAFDSKGVLKLTEFSSAGKIGEVVDLSRDRSGLKEFYKECGRTPTITAEYDLICLEKILKEGYIRTWYDTATI